MLYVDSQQKYLLRLLTRKKDETELKQWIYDNCIDGY